MEEAAGSTSAMVSAVSSVASIHQEVERATRSAKPIADLLVHEELKRSTLSARPVLDAVEMPWEAAARVMDDVAGRFAAKSAELARSRALLSDVMADSVGRQMKLLNWQRDLVSSVGRMEDYVRAQETVSKALAPSLEAVVESSAERISRQAAALSTATLHSFVQDAARVLQALKLPEHLENVTLDSSQVSEEDLDEFLAEVENLPIEDLPEHFESQDNPWKRRVLAWLVAHLWLLLFNVLANVGGDYVYDLWKGTASEKKAAAKVARQQANQVANRLVEDGVPGRDLRRWRVVTVPVLNVRAKPARQSQKIGEVHLGDIVIVHRTRCRSWTLIEWMDGDGELGVRGWVFTRYLVKLNLPDSVPDGNRPLADYDLGD